MKMSAEKKVLVPFYRGAVVFLPYDDVYLIEISSRPLLSRSGCISKTENNGTCDDIWVLVPFYRGAVVFKEKMK